MTGVQDLSAYSKDHPACKHDREGVLESSEAEYEVSEDAEGGGDDEDPPGSDFVDKHASKEGDNDVGESVESIEQIKLGLADGTASPGLVVFNGFLEGLGSGRSTLGLSKQY